MGFGPQVVDLDGDGQRDVITGSWPGELYLFQGAEGGAFAAARKLVDKDGEEMKLGSASVVFAVDWDRDGDLDLVVGDIEGHVWFVENESGTKELSFGPALKLAADGEIIRVEHGDSGPVVADWDGDGTLDVIVGAGDGSVTWFPNTTREGAPVLGAGRALIAGNRKPPAEDSACGRRTKPHVLDWNGDGRLDLLVGDFNMTPPKKTALGEEDEFRKIALEAELQALQRKMRPITRKVMEGVLEEMEIELPAGGGLGTVFQDLTDEQRKAYGERMQAAFQAHPRMKLLQARMQEVLQELGPLQGRPQVHGYVWLFLRKAPAATTNASAGG